MTTPDNNLIYQTLLEQNKQLGRIEATVAQAAKAFDSHVADDKLLDKRLGKLEGAYNRFKGAAVVWGLVTSGIGAILNWYFTSTK